MPKYIPKRDDIVFIDGKGFSRYVVIRVNSRTQTADVKNVSGGLVVQYDDVSWDKLLHLDESQNALRIMREATENK